jgi:hypothetical protein
MDRGRNIVVARTHTLSSVLLSCSITCSRTLRHTRIVVLGFVTHSIVQDSALKRVLRVFKSPSEDQGSLSWSSSIRYHRFLLISSLPLFLYLFLFFFFFHLYSLIIDLVEVLLRPFHSKGT